jgi:hypothetical protein
MQGCQVGAARAVWGGAFEGSGTPYAALAEQTDERGS